MRLEKVPNSDQFEKFVLTNKTIFKGFIVCYVILFFFLLIFPPFGFVTDGEDRLSGAILLPFLLTIIGVIIVWIIPFIKRVVGEIIFSGNSDNFLLSLLTYVAWLILFPFTFALIMFILSGVIKSPSGDDTALILLAVIVTFCFYGFIIPFASRNERYKLLSSVAGKWNFMISQLNSIASLPKPGGLFNIIEIRRRGPVQTTAVIQPVISKSVRNAISKNINTTELLNTGDLIALDQSGSLIHHFKQWEMNLLNPYYGTTSVEKNLSFVARIRATIRDNQNSPKPWD